MTIDKEEMKRRKREGIFRLAFHFPREKQVQATLTLKSHGFKNLQIFFRFLFNELDERSVEILNLLQKNHAGNLSKRKGMRNAQRRRNKLEIEKKMFSPISDEDRKNVYDFILDNERDIDQFLAEEE